MLCMSLPRLCHPRMMKTGAVNAPPTVISSLGVLPRFDFDGCGGCWIGNGKGRSNELTAAAIPKALKKRRLSISPLASSALVETRNSPRANFYQEVLKAARDKFTREISFQSKDKDISLAKTFIEEWHLSGFRKWALRTLCNTLPSSWSDVLFFNASRRLCFYIAAEDEAYMAFNREIDLQSIHKERREAMFPSDPQEWDCLETMPLGGKNVNQWLAELDAIAREVEAELVPREIGCHLVEVLEAVNVVLFESRGLKRSPVLLDSKCAYLHSVLNSGCCSAILLSVIYIEVCRRLNLSIVGSRVGEDFLIWPPTGNPEELFKVTSGHSLFGVVNGKCVNDPKSKASDIDSNSLLGLEIATNRDIIGIALANLIRLYWKRASRTNHGLMLTSPLRSVQSADHSNIPLLRPQDLRLAIMASQRLLILQPHNWALRRDYGMMLYFSREFEAAVQELSICMAFAPEEEAEILEPFVEKLHLLRLESSWKSLGHKGRLTVT